MTDEYTQYLKLPLPHWDNQLEEDLLRLREALLRVDAYAAKVGVILASDDADLDTIKELVAAIKADKVTIDQLLTGKADAEAVSKALAALEKQLENHAVLIVDMLWHPEIDYKTPIIRLGSNGKLYLWKKASGPAVAGVGAKDPADPASSTYWLDYEASLFAHMMDHRLCQYEWFEDDMPRLGFFSCLGGVVTNFAATYPKAAAYFNTTYGKKRLVTQAQYDALHVYSWHTKADGTKVGWEGIGGVAKFVWDKAKDTLRLPDLAGMTPEQVGYLDSLGVGGVRGDGQRLVTGFIEATSSDMLLDASGATLSQGGALYASKEGTRSKLGNVAAGTSQRMDFDNRLVTPVGPRNHGPRWVSDARVYLGQPAL